MAEEAEFLTLLEDEPVSRRRRRGRGWKVAIVDDDQGVHTGTRFALQDFTLHGRGLELLSARSAAEARELFRAHPDMAVILLDVVMETEGAGLELVAVRPQGAEERDGPHHPAHRPARPGAGAPRRRRLRHQRLQGEDRAHRRQALHHADGGAPELRAAPEAGADAARAGDHHRRGGDALRPALAAAPRRGRADAALLADGGRVRRHSGAARDRAMQALSVLAGSGCYQRLRDPRAAARRSSTRSPS